jgi:IS30 family transposase
MIESMRNDRELITQSLSLRTLAKISLRQSLNEVYLAEKINFEEIFKEELNIKNISYTLNKYQSEISSEDKKITLDLHLTQDLINEGKVREFIRKVQDLRKNSKLNVEDRVTVSYSPEDISPELVAQNHIFLTKKLNAAQFTQESETKVTILD